MMIHARELAAMPRDKLWQLGDGPIKVIFDDGVVESHGRATIYSAYMWDLYTLYPKTPAKMAHHLGEARVGSNTHLDLLNAVLWDCYDAYKGDYAQFDGPQAFIERLGKHAYRSTNNIYNDFTYRLEAYVKTLSILDFVDVVYHPKIKEANDSVLPSNQSIEKCYEKIAKVLKDPKELRGNPVAESAKNGLVDMRQTRQCVGPRGAVTDVSSTFFRDPILKGYMHGMTNLQDSMMESRSAAKSLMFTEEPLQKTEYFNRQLQLLCGTLEFLDFGDCGSEGYLMWIVNPGDLQTLAGKYYLTNQGLQRITEKDVHLHGEKIYLRSILHCKHQAPRTVCSTCFGEMSLSIPRWTCLGHVSATAMCEMISQSVLSIKHVDSASGMDGVQLSEYDQQFFEVGIDPNTLRLSPKLENKRVVMSFSSKEAANLSSITYVEDPVILPVATISTLSSVQLDIYSDNREETVTLSLTMGQRMASFTHDALRYIKEKSWTLTATGNYSVDLSEWPMELPLFIMPLKHENMLDYMATIEKFIKAGEGGTQKTLRDFTTVESALRELHSIVTSQLKVNVAHLEVIIKSVMVRSSQHHDYRIPVEGNKVEFGTFSNLMTSRSLTETMAYQGHKKIIVDPAAYLPNMRPSHPLDPLLDG